jgi:hypothetical protein
MAYMGLVGTARALYAERRTSGVCGSGLRTLGLGGQNKAFATWCRWARNADTGQVLVRVFLVWATVDAHKKLIGIRQIGTISLRRGRRRK